MSIKEIFIREVAVANDHNTIHEAALFMRKAHVGVPGGRQRAENPGGNPSPAGMWCHRWRRPGWNRTASKSPRSWPPNPTVVHEQASIWSTIQLMHDKGVRRLPVMNDSQERVGIITADDMLGLLSKQLHSLIEVIDQEQMEEINRLG